MPNTMRIPCKVLRNTYSPKSVCFQHKHALVFQVHTWLLPWVWKPQMQRAGYNSLDRCLGLSLFLCTTSPTHPKCTSLHLSWILSTHCISPSLSVLYNDKCSAPLSVAHGQNTTQGRFSLLLLQMMPLSFQPLSLPYWSCSLSGYLVSLKFMLSLLEQNALNCKPNVEEAMRSKHFIYLHSLPKSSSSKHRLSF